MTNGEEIICQVMEWPEESDTDYIVNNALLVMQTIVNESHTKYMFKPWFTMAERSDQYISISKEHVVACVKPNDSLQTEYKNAKKEMYNRARSRTSVPALEDFEKMQKQQYDQLQKEIMSLIDEMERDSHVDVDLPDDSDGGTNVIKFPGPGTVH